MAEAVHHNATVDTSQDCVSTAPKKTQETEGAASKVGHEKAVSRSGSSTTRASSAVEKNGVSHAFKKTQDQKGIASKASHEKAISRSGSSSTTRTMSAVEKKIPPIKAPVGNAPPPKVKQAKSKIGSLDNVTHKPKGGERKVESVKLEWNAKPKVGSLDYATYKPGGGDKKIITQKLDFKNVQSRVGSKDNLKHKPGGGNLKVATEKLDFKSKAASKVGSLENATHKPGGGNVVIKSEKLNFKERAAPKIQSKSGSEMGSSHGGSEATSPVMPSSPAPPENMPPLCEDENPSSQEEDKKTVESPTKVSNIHDETTCNGGTIAKDPPQDVTPISSHDMKDDEQKDSSASPLKENNTINGSGDVGEDC